MVNSVIPPLLMKISHKDASFHISINVLGLYLFPGCLLNFLSNLYIPQSVEKIFKFMVLAFLENALNLGIFPQVFPKFLSSHPRQREIAHSRGQHFFENLFPPTAQMGGGNYDLLYQNSIRKYEDDLEH